MIAFATGLSQLPFLPSALKYSKVIGDLSSASSAVSPEELASAADPVSVLDPPLLLPLSEPHPASIPATIADTNMSDTTFLFIKALLKMVYVILHSFFRLAGINIIFF